MISIRRTCSLFARAYPKATLLAPTLDARPAFTRNYSGAEVQFGALDRLAACVASIEPSGTLLRHNRQALPVRTLPSFCESRQADGARALDAQWVVDDNLFSCHVRDDDRVKGEKPFDVSQVYSDNGKD